ncbi:Golgi-specific brefeldin A-resistance guanine nucleotide exchange factor 1 [Manis javanica]|nr:Golgi-specific brefeldin A-resistance guanine nucleotide exchange factor 1 [Manis javanica]
MIGPGDLKTGFARPPRDTEVPRDTEAARKVNPNTCADAVQLSSTTEPRFRASLLPRRWGDADLGTSWKELRGRRTGESRMGVKQSGDQKRGETANLEEMVQLNEQGSWSPSAANNSERDLTVTPGLQLKLSGYWSRETREIGK